MMHSSMPTNGNALRGFTRNGRRDDFREARRVGAFIGAAGSTVAGIATPLIAVNPLVFGPIAGLGIAAAGVGALTQQNEDIARTFGASGITTEDKDVFNKRQADIANRISDAAQARGGRYTGAAPKGAKVGNKARAALANNVRAYQAKARSNA